MKISDHIFFNINKEKFTQVREFIVNELTDKKDKLIKDIGEMCILDSVENKWIIGKREELKEIQKIILRLDYSAKYLFEYDLDLIIEKLGITYTEKEHTFLEKINEILIGDEN